MPPSKNAKKLGDSPQAGPAVRGVLVVDDHPFMRDGIKRLITAQPDLFVCGEAASPQEAFQHIAKSRPDLVLTDMSMPGRSGMEFIRDLAAQHPGLRILVVSAHDELVYAERALQAGARGYLMKDQGAEKMLAAIRRVLDGEIAVSPQVSTALLENMTLGRRRPTQSPIEKLTDREFEIFQLIGEGKSTRAIAEQLSLSAKTVEAHRSNIKVKLELGDATALVRYAVRWIETR